MNAAPWQMIEGQIVGGRYHLTQYLGCGGSGGVPRFRGR